MNQSPTLTSLHSIRAGKCTDLTACSLPEQPSKQPQSEDQKACVIINIASCEFCHREAAKANWNAYHSMPACYFESYLDAKPHTESNARRRLSPTGCDVLSNAAQAAQALSLRKALRLDQDRIIELKVSVKGWRIAAPRCQCCQTPPTQNAKALSRSITEAV